MALADEEGVEINELISEGKYKQAADIVADLPAYQIADELTRLSGLAQAATYRFLPKDTAFSAFRLLEPVIQQELVEELRSDEAIALIEHLDPDDRVQLLDEMPAMVVRRMLEQLTPGERKHTAVLIGYPAGTMGRRMNPVVANVHVDTTVSEALDRIRRFSNQVKRLDIIAVTDAQRLMIGVVRLSELVLAEPSTLVSDLVDRDWPWLSAYQDEESAARLMQQTDLLVLPVVDAEHRLVGILTADDAMEVLEAADTEDFSRASGIEPMRRPYLTASILDLARHRVVWLLLLIAAAALTVQVLGHFEATLAEVVTLALFIPLLIGTGGNVGAQAATTVVRAMAIGEIRSQDSPRVIVREFATGAMLGTMLGGIAFAPITYFFGQELAIVVSASLLLVCAWASTVGSAMPMIARKVGIDPALVSAPLVTTLVDATGLIVYFVVAQIVLLG